MELFYSDNTDNGRIVLSPEESAHCARVLRHRAGDMIDVIDGHGTLYRCRICDDSPKGVVADIEESTAGWGAHPYHLTMAVAPTKNIDRYEWFVEKACETGVDAVVPVIGEHSERRTLRTDRLRKILVSAAKQSLKAAVPEVFEPVSVADFIRSNAAVEGDGVMRLIACCFDEDNAPRVSIREVLERSVPDHVVIMIGPEGDFSREEAALAVQCGFVPVHLGESRFRTETAALAAVAFVYHRFM